jgi:hypothetical protein
MGVDQHTSVHRFDDLADGGRITLQRDTDDAVGTTTIRRHLHDIAGAFARGDFSTPAFVHMRSVPGATTMASRRARIRYAVDDVARGGTLSMTSTDRPAVNAIHAFLAYQRADHHATGHLMQDEEPASAAQHPARHTHLTRPHDHDVAPAPH